MIGREIGQYRILEKLGAGAMGEVYKAVDQSLQRPVALKFLSTQLLADQHARERFLQEARAAAVLRHDAVCTVYEIGATEDQTYIAMEFCDGETLKGRLDGPDLTVEEALDITIRIAHGLQQAHENGVVHRDLKPSNIMMVPGRGPVLMDFGIARRVAATRLTMTGTTMGTAAYMSPEQGRGAETDHRTDIWSCGVILYEMLAGILPFRGDFDAALLYSVAHSEPDPLADLNPGVPFELEQIVGTCLTKDPDRRYASASGLADDLEEIRGRLTEDREPERYLWFKRFIRTPRRLLAVGALILAVGAMAVGGSHLFRQKPISSLAVLPFADLSGQAGQEYYIEGITDQLITELQIMVGDSNLRIIGRTTAMRYLDSPLTLPEIAEELDVDAIVEGSVRRSGTRVHVTAKLIKADPERQIWADQFERDEKEILQLNAMVAGTIAGALDIGLPDEKAQGQVMAAPTVDPKAYELFLQGRHSFNLVTLASIRRAVILYEEALKLDPEFAPAWAHLAEAKGMLVQMEPLPIGEGIRRAQQDAEHALRLSEDSAAAQAILTACLMLELDVDYQMVELHSRRALELNPNDPTALLYRAQFMLELGRLDEHRVLLDRALKIDPFNPFLRANLVFGSGFAGDLAKARDAYDLTIALDPDNLVARWGLGWSLLMVGEYEEARSILKEGHETTFSIEEGSPEILPALLATLAALGRTEEIADLRADVEAAAERRYIPAIFIACLDGAQGREAAALDRLEEGIEENDFRVAWTIDLLQGMLYPQGEPSERILALKAKIEAFQP